MLATFFFIFLEKLRFEKTASWRGLRPFFGCSFERFLEKVKTGVDTLRHARYYSFYAPALPGRHSSDSAALFFVNWIVMNWMYFFREVYSANKCDTSNR